MNDITQQRNQKKLNTKSIHHQQKHPSTPIIITEKTEPFSLSPLLKIFQEKN